MSSSDSSEFVEVQSIKDAPTPGLETPQDIFLKDQARFRDVFGNHRLGQKLALRAALLKQSLLLKPNVQHTDVNTHSKGNDAVEKKYIEDNMRKTVLRDFRRTQRLKKIDAQAADQRGRQTLAKLHRSEIISDLIHQEFVKKRLNNLRLEILATNCYPEYAHFCLFRRALWMVELAAGGALGILFEKFRRRKRIKSNLQFPGIIQNFWRARQGLRIRRRKKVGNRKFMGAICILILLVRIWKKFVKRRWGVRVLVSVLKTKKDEYAVKMYMRRFAVCLLKIQRWWRHWVVMTRSRVAIMSRYVLMYDGSINKNLCTLVCTQHYTKMKFSDKVNFPCFKAARPFWFLTVSQARDLASLCRKTASSLASEWALSKFSKS